MRGLALVLAQGLALEFVAYDREQHVESCPWSCGSLVGVMTAVVLVASVVGHHGPKGCCCCCCCFHEEQMTDGCRVTRMGLCVVVV